MTQNPDRMLASDTLDALIIFRGWVSTNPACPALPTLLRRVERRGRPMSARSIGGPHTPR